MHREAWFPVPLTCFPVPQNHTALVSSFWPRAIARDRPVVCPTSIGAIGPRSNLPGQRVRAESNWGLTGRSVAGQTIETAPARVRRLITTRSRSPSSPADGVDDLGD